MDDEMSDSLHERLSALEEKSIEQEAQIDALIAVLSDQLAAHAVLHKDVRIFSFLRQYIESAQEKQRKGGARHYSKSYFGALSDCIARILEQSANSIVFDKFWSKSVFLSREERQRAKLRKISDAIRRKLEF